MIRSDPLYTGFEQGPIRPPSEAQSLLVRLTRNCPWNHCTFCPVYKGTRFSIRPVEHVVRDIESIHHYISVLKDMADRDGPILKTAFHRVSETLASGEKAVFRAAFRWFLTGMETVFLQDANSLIIKPNDMVHVLTLIRERFPRVKRITSYARSRTIVKMRDEDLVAIRDAGLNRIHIGMESGSDRVLELVRKGATGRDHVEAGLKVKRAGFELSEYVMPGLGGRALSRAHALETAEALTRIDPDFIRIRTLAIPDTVPLRDQIRSGQFQKCTEVMVAQELLLLIEHLGPVTGVVKSDHILNLCESVEGRLPDDKDRMLQPLHRFLEMDPEHQCLYLTGRRLGLFSDPEDMQRPRRLEKARQLCREMNITPENVDQLSDQLMKRFI